MTSLFGGRLLYWKKNGKNKTVYTTRGTSVKFGKGLFCHFRLKSPDALGLHCKIFVGKYGKIQIMNYSEEHPVLVNEECVVKKQVLKSGDRIEILNKKFVWEYSSVPEEGKAVDREDSLLKLGSKRRICKSEPGRKRKLHILGKGMAVSILTPLRGRKITPSFTRNAIEEVNKTEEATLMEHSKAASKEDDTAIEVSKSLYGTPMNSLASTLVSPKAGESMNLIDLNTPAPTKDFQTTPDTSDIFKTPMRHTYSTRSVKTPATVANFEDLPQSTPIELPGRKTLNLDESVITIDDSDESRTIDDSVKFVPITPQRVLRSATKAITPAKTPRTPLSVKKSTPKALKTPRSVKKELSTPTNPPRLTKRPATSVRKTRSTKCTKLNISDTTGGKVARTVSEDPNLMTLENLADITESGRDKENMSTPHAPKSLPRSEKKSAQSARISKTRSPLNNLSNVSGVKRLFVAQAKTPNLRGVRELMKTPKAGDLRQVDGVKELFTVASPKNDLLDVRGVRKLFRTPGREKRDALEEFPGVKSLMQEPKEKNDLTNVVGVRELLATPKDGNKLENLVGVKELMRTPQDQDESLNFLGVRDLMKEIPDAEDSLRFKGVRELMKTPDKDVSMQLSGVRQLLKEPPEADVSVRLAGIREMMKTPEKETPVNLVGVKELLKEPVNSTITHNLTGLGDLYTIPEEQDIRESLPQHTNDKETSSSSGVVEVEIDATMDEVFDSLKGRLSMPSIKHTYSRKESPKKAEEKVDPKGIQEWIDSIVTTADTTTPKRANNTLQVLSDKYSNVTPSGSKSLLPDAEESEEVLETPARKETSGRVASLRKRAIVQSINLSSNISLEFGEGVTSTPMSPRGRPRKVPPKETPIEKAPETPTGRSLRNRRGNMDNSEKNSNEKPRRGRKPKVVTFVEPIPPSPAVEEMKPPEIKKRTTRKKAEAEKVIEEVSPVRPKRTRKATVKLQESLETVKPSPRRGRPPKKVQEVEEVKEKEPTPKTRGRKPRKVKSVSPVVEVEEQKIDELIPEKRTTRRAKAAKVEEKKSPERPEPKTMSETETPKDDGKKTRSRRKKTDDTPVVDEPPRRNLRPRRAK